MSLKASKTNHSLGKSIKVLWEPLLRLAIWIGASRGKSRGLRWPAVVWVPRFCKRCRKGGLGKAPVLVRTCGTVCACAQRPPVGMLQGRVGPHGELFFFLIKKEPVSQTSCRPTPFVSAETLKACALIGLHRLAAERGARSSGSPSPDLGDMWRQGCPKSQEWISSCSVSETSLGCKRGGSALSRGLGAWASSFELPHDHGSSLPRNEGCMLGSLRSLGSPWSAVAANKPFSQGGRAATLDRLSSSVLLNILCLFRNEGVPSFRLCASLFCIVQMVFPTFDVCTLEERERAEFRLFGLLLWIFQATDVPVREVSLLARSHVPSVLNHRLYI